MATKTLVSGRAGWTDANGSVRMMADRRPFRTHGSLSGTFYLVGNTLGDLPPRFRVEYGEAVKTHGRALFVVYSYATPIAWFAPDGTTNVPDTRYSVTTSRHQHSARMAAGIVNGEIPRPSGWDNA